MPPPADDWAGNRSPASRDWRQHFCRGLSALLQRCKNKLHLHFLQYQGFLSMSVRSADAKSPLEAGLTNQRVWACASLSLGPPSQCGKAANSSCLTCAWAAWPKGIRSKGLKRRPRLHWMPLWYDLADHVSMPEFVPVCSRPWSGGCGSPLPFSSSKASPLNSYHTRLAVNNKAFVPTAGYS